MRNKPLDRRTFLRGAGTLIALPFLEVMLPLRAFAQAAGVPQRFVAIYFGNGVIDWNCTGTENNWTLPQNLLGLLPFKADITPIQGLINDAGLFGYRMDGTTAHWQASTAYLTGQTYDWPNRATRVALYGAGSSLDQMIAQATPNNKKSLVMGCHPNYLYAGGSSVRGSHQYLTNISWTNQTTQTPRFVSSKSVFDYLFSNGIPTQSNAAALARAAQKKSILDDVLGDIQKLNSRLGASDKQKLDEFFTSVNEVQRRVAAEVPSSQVICTVPNNPSYISDANNGGDGYTNPVINQRARNMADMLTIAFQCDITRVSSFMLTVEHSYENVFYYEGANGSTVRHHDASHYLDNATVYRPVMNTFKRWEAAQFAYLLGKLKNTSDVNGPLLNSTLLMFGTGMGDPHNHDLRRVPMILAGRGAGHVPGKLLNMNGARHTDLLATIAQKFKLPAKVGMSQGTFGNI